MQGYRSPVRYDSGEICDLPGPFADGERNPLSECGRVSLRFKEPGNIGIPVRCKVVSKCRKKCEYAEDFRQKK